MKQAIIGAVLTAAFAIGLLLYIQRRHSAEIDGLKSSWAADNSELIRTRNKLGQSVASEQAAIMSLQQYKDTHPEEIAQIARDFNLKPKQLRWYLAAAMRAKGSGVSVIYKQPASPTGLIDSVPAWFQPGKNADSTRHWFAANDGYLNFYGSIINDSTTAWLYSYTDTVSFVGRTRRKGLFGKTTYWVDGKVGNPSAELQSLRNVQIKEFVDKRWSIGPAVVLDPFSGSVRVGVGVQYALVKF